MNRQDDAQEIRRRLEDDIEGVLDDLYPGWVKRGKTAYLTPKSKKELGSFTVSLDDSNKMPRGSWYRFSQSIGGGSVELVSYWKTGRKDSYREAFDWGRKRFGMSNVEETPQERAEREERQAKERLQREAKAKADAEEAARKREERTLDAHGVWDETIPLRGTLGEEYLVGRGIPPVAEWPWNPDETIRFHPSLDFEPDKRAGRFAAVVCKVVDPFGDLIAVWQIYLFKTADGRVIKADLSPSPKIGRGPATGGAIRIGGDAAEIDVAEGSETALGAWFLINHRKPVWSLMSTSGMKGFEPPAFVERIGIWKDGDKAVLDKQTGRILPPPGENAAEQLQRRLKNTGIKCPIHDVCRDGDALDLWNARQKFEQHAKKEEA